MKAALLPERGVVKVAGEDARKFLNGLLTADIAKVTPQHAAYAALLTPQGKILADMIVAEAPAEDGGGFFLDVPRALCRTLVDRLNFYKLRAKVIVEDLSEVLGVMAVWDGAGETEYGLCYADPRLPGLGMRCMLPPHLATDAAADLGAALVDASEYEAHRIALGAPRGGLDFHYNDAFPHEADMDQLNGVDFDKGLLCRAGSRVARRASRHGAQARGAGDIRGFRTGSGHPGEGRRCGGRRDGELGRRHRPRPCHAAPRPCRGCAGVRTPLMSGGIALHPVKPAWARFDWPGEAKAAE